MISYVSAVGFVDHRHRVREFLADGRRMISYLSAQGSMALAQSLKRERDGCMITYLAAQTNTRVVTETAIAYAARTGVVRLPFLVSFHYFRRKTAQSIIELFPQFKVQLLVDSGGFSAATLGERISLVEYCRYIKANADALEGYANLDVIGDPVKSSRNFNIMVRDGLSPFPVFHVGSEWKYLDEILERSPQRMALGGMVPYLKGRQVELRRWLAAAFKRIAERAPRTMVHGFGVGSSIAVLKDYPWHSVDSSAWTSAYQFRSIDVFDERRGEFVKVSCSRGQDGPIRHRELLRLYGFTPAQFYRDRYNYRDAGALSLMSVFRAEQWVNDRWRERA